MLDPSLPGTTLPNLALALLVDEDMSAVNFIAQDGRTRAMIMGEPITPLLYWVNGLFLAKEHQVSTVAAVGGVVEWLDMSDAVVLMKDYAAYDGLAKARSVMYQFSYGHVQYGGRGVVHRLPWEVKEEKTRVIGDDGGVGNGSTKAAMEEKSSPTTTLSSLGRRPESDCIANKFRDAAVHLLDGGSSRLQFYHDYDDNAKDVDTGDEDDGMVDMSKCSQLESHASEKMYHCGLCVLWLIREATGRPTKDLSELLDCMDRALDRDVMVGLMASLRRGRDYGNVLLAEIISSHAAQDLWKTMGYVCRPRGHDVAMPLVRMRDMKFDILPEKLKALEMCPEEDAKRREEESRKMVLAELWANRRNKGGLVFIIE
eukprot:CAMPEP_0201630612 /NCGR_PEP_ID=MMETSP0493-20130528/4884_1 /ASSEMBLY_ACC=CAM_ASM_000838 /TAXON_ID=420259 /ORGANISM="Thalassiosira gravida, Strain GMp14c1" /LENGTH=370 /DNA_ID=CAMNT_0048101813 /DNA_START=429 /DNA_END=1541 /DNA_ORIENTATION=+